MKIIKPHIELQNLSQYRFELDGFRRQMNFISDENIFLKNRLSEVLKEYHAPAHLEELEAFQNRFLHYDVVISIARNDIADLEAKCAVKNDINREDLSRLSKMRNGFLSIIIEFIHLGSDFNIFLSEKI